MEVHTWVHGMKKDRIKTYRGLRYRLTEMVTTYTWINIRREGEEEEDNDGSPYVSSSN